MLRNAPNSPRIWLTAFLATSISLRSCSAITVDIDQTSEKIQSLLALVSATDRPTLASLKNAASVAADGLVSWYKGNQSGQTPGLLPPPFYWWEAGAMFMSLIDYWSYTGDAQYNNITSQALVFQTGPNYDYMPPNQTKDLGNDDQSFWAFAAMEAAELNFPNPPEGGPQWLALAQAVFNLQANRWDTSSCAGGLRWQIYPFNTGYNYKNGISNGCFFNLASRLYRYTGNQTYYDWAVQMYDWTAHVGLVGSKYEVFDGSNDLLNCSQIDHDRWTYNAGVFLHGAANMWNKTKDPIWQTRVEGFVSALPYFFENKVMYEPVCEPTGLCDTDQLSFKAYLSRWMAATTQLAPFTYSQITPYLRASAIAAAAQCDGGTAGTTCGLRWVNNATYDGTFGPGQQMSAMAVFGANLIAQAPGPVTAETGGTSKGDSGAGSSGDVSTQSIIGGSYEITTKDRVGAWILTSAFGIFMLGGAAWTVV